MDLYETVDLDADVYRPPVRVSWTDADGVRQAILVNPNRYSTEAEIAFGVYVRRRRDLLNAGNVEDAERLFVANVAQLIAADNPEWTEERLVGVPSKVLGKVQLFFVSPDEIPPSSSAPAAPQAPPDQSQTRSTPAPPAAPSNPLPIAA